MRYLLLLILLIPFIGTSQTTIPKKANTIVVSLEDSAKGLKKLAKQMIKEGYELEKDWELGYVNGVYTKEAKPFKGALQLKIKAYEEDGKIYVSGDFSIFQKGNGEFNQFDIIAWKGVKKGAWKTSFEKMKKLVENLGELKYIKI